MLWGQSFPSGLWWLGCCPKDVGGKGHVDPALWGAGRVSDRRDVSRPPVVDSVQSVLSRNQNRSCSGSSTCSRTPVQLEQPGPGVQVAARLSLEKSVRSLPCVFWPTILTVCPLQRLRVNLLHCHLLWSPLLLKGSFQLTKSEKITSGLS